MKFKELQEVIDNHTFTVFDTEVKKLLKSIIERSENIEEVISNILVNRVSAKYIINESNREMAYASTAISEITYDLIETLRKNVSTSREIIKVEILSCELIGIQQSPASVYLLIDLIDNYKNMKDDAISNTIKRMIHFNGFYNTSPIIEKLSTIIPCVEIGSYYLLNQESE